MVQKPGFIPDQVLPLQEVTQDLQRKAQPLREWLHHRAVQEQDMHHRGLPQHITVLTGQVQLITEVQAAAVLQEHTVHLLLRQDPEVLTKVVHPQEAAVAVTAAVALPPQGVILRVVRAAQEAAGHHHLLPHHQAEEGKRMSATNLSINKKAI